MKYIVMQIEDGQAVLLDNRGNFITVKDRGYAVGQTIQYRKPSMKTAYAAAAGLIVALGLGGTTAKMYYTPVSYLSIEINPSIQLSINMFDRVIGYECFNKDGEIVLEDVDIINLKSKLSVEKIIDTAQGQGYINDTNNSVIIDVVEKNTALIDNLTPLREKYVAKNIEVTLETANEDDAKLSREKNISIAKAKAVNEYSQVYGEKAEEVSEKLKNVSVKEVKAKNKEAVNETQNKKSNTETVSSLVKTTVEPTVKPVLRGYGANNKAVSVPNATAFPKQESISSSKKTESTKWANESIVKIENTFKPFADKAEDNEQNEAKNEIIFDNSHDLIDHSRPNDAEEIRSEIPSENDKNDVKDKNNSNAPEKEEHDKTTGSNMNIGDKWGTDFGIGQDNKGETTPGTSQGNKEETNSGISQGNKEETNSGISQGNKGESNSNISQGNKGESNSNISQGNKGESNSNISQGNKGESNPNISQGNKGETNSGISQGNKGETNSGISQGNKGESNPNISQGNKGETNFGISQGNKGETNSGSAPDGKGESGIGSSGGSMGVSKPSSGNNSVSDSNSGGSKAELSSSSSSNSMKNPDKGGSTPPHSSGPSADKGNGAPSGGNAPSKGENASSGGNAPSKGENAPSGGNAPSHGENKERPHSKN